MHAQTCRSMLLRVGLQASPALYHPQHEPPTTNARRSTASINPDALLHTFDANKQSVYSRWEG
jgi:hypothetical protein